MAPAELIYFDPWDVMPGPDRVLARGGCPPPERQRFSGGVDRALKELAEVSSPAAAWSTMAIGQVSGKTIATDGIVFRSSSLAVYLKGSSELTVFLATIGPGAEELASELQGSGMYLESYLLDAAASEMVEEVARRLHRALAGEYPEQAGTARFAPGYGDLSLSCQRDILRLVEGDRLGVRLLEGSYILSPAKSTTGVMGWNR